MFISDNKKTSGKLFFLPIIILIGILAGCSNLQQNDNSYNKEVAVHTQNNSNYNEDDTTDDINTYVLVSGDGYSIIKRWEESFQGTVIEYGVEYNNELIQPFSTSHIFNQRDQNDEHCDNYLYLGENTFMAYVDCEIVFTDGTQAGAANPSGRGIVYLYNAKLNKSLVYGNTISVALFNEEYLLIAHKDGYDAIVTIIDSNFNECGSALIDVGNTCPSLGPFSNGLFYFDGCFYNSSGQKAIDLGQFIPSLYDVETKKYISPCFSDGKCYIELENPNGTEYYVEIDVNGDFLYEPIKKE